MFHAQCSLRRFLLCALLLTQGAAALAADACTAKAREETAAHSQAAFDQGSAAFTAGDHAGAFAAWEPLARAGDCHAQYNLGTLYLSGRGVTADAGAAVEWFNKAAAQGHAQAQFNVGEAYRTGTGSAKDPRQALLWYTRAADQGLAEAQHFAAIAYATGQGVDRDYGKAMHYYRLAAAQGHAAAEYNLGLMYAFGNGTPRDKVLAYFHVGAAAAAGYERGPRSVEVIAAKMSNEQLAEARQLLAQWKPGTAFPEASLSGQDTKQAVIESTTPQR